MSQSIINYIFNHQYNLRKVSEEEKKFVKEHKRKSTTLSKTFEYKELLVLKFPGIVYSDSVMFSKYSLKIYEPLYSTVFTPPRGYVDKSSTVVVGVAPGWSHLSFGEPNWLYGPSSRTLHEVLGFDYRWYITNVSKEPFFKNKYNKELVDRFYYDLLKELDFFKGHKIIFLGKYGIYDKIIKDLNIREYLKAYHPSYFGYKGKTELNRQIERIKEFVL